MSHTTVLDHDGLIRLFRTLAGRKFIGPVDGTTCVELVFDDPDDKGGNLLSIFTGDYHRGAVAHGFVDQALIEDDGYGRGDAGRPEPERRALVQALERCAFKLKVEYDRQQPDAPPGECWAEAEAAWALLHEEPPA